MNKRSFLRVLTAGLTGAPLSGWMAKKPLTNWAGNLAYSAERVLQADSVAMVQRSVKADSQIKVQGTRHCFNAIADCRKDLLWVAPMHEVVDLNVAARTVTIEAGLTYGKLCPHLEQKGWALHNLASLPHISVAGACSTATHGSGEKNGNLATAVRALEMVNGQGEVVQLSRDADKDLFRGAVVGLGALGVITKITLAVEPAYTMRQYVYENLPLTQMSAHFDEIQSSGYSVSLFTDWQKQRVNEVWVKDRGDRFAAPREWFGATLATKNLHPIAEISAENCTEQMGVAGPWYERLPHFKMGFTPSAGKELQSEYFVPRDKAVDAILAVERLRDQVSPHLLISEIRTIAADDLWMSMAYGRPSVAIHFTWKQDWPAVRRVLPVLERELGVYKVRPHWGKLFAMNATVLRTRYERWDEFVALAKKWDTQGKFRNQFLMTNLFGEV